MNRTKDSGEDKAGRDALAGAAADGSRKERNMTTTKFDEKTQHAHTVLSAEFQRRETEMWARIKALSKTSFRSTYEAIEAIIAIGKTAEQLKAVNAARNALMDWSKISPAA